MLVFIMFWCGLLTGLMIGSLTAADKKRDQ